MTLEGRQVGSRHFDRIEEQGREILRRVGYGNDLQESTLALLHKQSVVVEFVEDLRAAGVAHVRGAKRRRTREQRRYGLGRLAACSE